MAILLNYFKLAEKKAQMALCQTSVLKLYHAVIEDVIASVRDAFLDEGVDEQVLQEMKQIWRTKLMASKAVEINPEPSEPQPPQIIVNNPKPSKAAAAKAKKAAAAAAAAAQQNTSTSILTTVSGADIKPSVASLGSIAAAGGAKTTSSAIGNGPSTSISSNAMLNGGSIKQEHQQNPPPLHPTQQHQQLLHQQKTSLIQGSTMSQQQQTNQQQQQQQSSASAIPAVAALDPNKIMPVNITLPAQPSQPGTMNSESRVLTIHVPASALQENQLTQILTAHLISSIMSLPTTLASSVLQQHVNAALVSANMQKNFNTSKQLDGALDTSDEDESEESDDNMDNDDDDDPDKDDDDDVENEGGAEEEPLNSEDDVTDEDASDLFDTDNVIVCQYDKITRSRNKWKFYLKDGIMNIGGKDYVFQKSNGDAEW